MSVFQGFVGGSYKMDALTFDSQRCVNLFPIVSESQTSATPSALRSVAGYENFASVGGGPIRNSIKTANGRAWCVSGYGFYEVFADGTSTLRGTLLTGVVRTGLAENNTQIMIVDGAYGYIYNMDTDVFTQITDVDFPVCDNVVFQDGYFIVTKKDTSQVHVSALYDGLTWDALDFGRADTNPDDLIGIISDHGNLWLLGRVSTEVWQNTGNLDFPFELISGAIVQTGCAAWGTVCKFNNTIAWLAADELGRGIVVMANGYAAQRISTQAIEAKIAQAGNLNLSYAYSYHEQGHIFYVLQVQGLNTTLVYDGSTGIWHERNYYNVDLSREEQHRGSCHMFFNNKHILGDRQSGTLYNQDLAIFSFDDDEIRRERVTPHSANERYNVTYARIELDMETGRGLSTGQGSDPMMMMQYSDDGGRTWSNERWVSVGKQGEYKKRVRWSRCGSALVGRVFKFRYTEPTFLQINGAYINGD